MVSWLLNEGAGEGIVDRNRASSANSHGSEETVIRLSVPAGLKRTGKEMKFIVDGVTNSAPADTTLIRLLVRGQKIAKRMFEPNCPPLEEIAHEERTLAQPSAGHGVSSLFPRLIDCHQSVAEAKGR